MGLLFLFILGRSFTPSYHKSILNAQNLIKAGNYSESLKVYQEVLEQSIPNKIRKQINFQIGNLLSVYLGDFDLAIEYLNTYKRLVELPDEYILVEKKIAEIFFKYKKNYEKAIKAYKNLINFRPRPEEYEEFEVKYGICLIELKRYEEATLFFQNIRSNSQHLFQNKSLYYLALINFHQGDFDKAVENFRIYLKREEDEDQTNTATILMANAYETSGKLDKAYEIYYNLYSKYPNPKIIKDRLDSLYKRRVAQKR